MCHVLVLADRDWTHPEGGGSGCNIYEQALRWRAEGHRVSMIVSRAPGAQRHELVDGIEIHRMGGRLTVFGMAAWRQSRGLVPKPDVVLEIVNGITFMTPLWLRAPRAVLVHHLHAGDHYREELGRAGRPAGALLETFPLKYLYRRTRFVCVSQATQDGVVALGVPRSHTTVNYNGVDLRHYAPGRRAPSPTFLVLGRIKRYKRIEMVLDAVTALPGVRLDIAGDGDHAPALRREVARRGLDDRVVLHGYVDEDAKRALLQRSWANVSASAAEGWGLTIMEAAACRTPSVAIAKGGPREAIAHDHSGLLARDGGELRDAMGRLAADPELVERLGEAARKRAHEYSWDRTARNTLGVLDSARREAAADGGAWRAFVRSDTVRAGGLAAAVLLNSAFALACTVAFARMLGTGSYGALASLLAAFLVLTVPGSALQLAVARAVSRDPGGSAEARARSALHAAIWLSVPIAAITALGREPLAAAFGVDLRWGAAATVFFGWLWLVLSLQRGVLQGRGRYLPVGVSLVVEAAARLAFGLALIAAGLGATGALLGTGCALVAAVVYLRVMDEGRPEPGRLGELWRLVGHSGAPLGALCLLAVLQNLDVILVKHRANAAGAGSYAEAAVASRTIVWLALGLGLFLLPEAARRARNGEDARGVLLRMMALVVAASAPLILVYALTGPQLLSSVFDKHSDTSAAGAALPVLTIAMTLLGVSYLAVHYLLALGSWHFGGLLILATVTEAVVVSAAPTLMGVALALLAVNALLAAALTATALAGEAPVAQRKAVGTPA